MKKETSRNLWPDLIRVFAIYGVVVLHTLFVYSPPVSTYLYRISETSIPLFVMLSGALLLDKTESYKVFFRKRCVKVLVPWIVWTIIYMLYYFYIKKDSYIISTFFSNASAVQAYNWGKFFIVQFLTGLWFLPLIFSLYLFTPFLRIFVQNAKKIDLSYILILWFIVIVILPIFLPHPLFPKWESSMIYAPLQYSGYFLLGYFLIKNKDIKFINFPTWFLIPILLFFALIPTSGFFDIGTVFGTVLLFTYIFSNSESLNKKINSNIKKIIGVLSAASLGIYVSHSLISYIVGARILYYLHAVRMDFLYTFLIFSISALIVIFIQRLPFLRRIFP